MQVNNKIQEVAQNKLIATLGKNIKLLRIRKNLSQKQLSRLSTLYNWNICNIENSATGKQKSKQLKGLLDMNFKNIVRLSISLDTPIEKLFSSHEILDLSLEVVPVAKIQSMIIGFEIKNAADVFKLALILRLQCEINFTDELAHKLCDELAVRFANGFELFFCNGYFFWIKNLNHIFSPKEQEIRDRLMSGGQTTYKERWILKIIDKKIRQKNNNGKI